MTILFWDAFPTPLGWIGVLASPRGLRATTLPCASAEEAHEALGPEAQGTERRPDLLAEVACRLQAHLSGERVSLKFPLDWEGRPLFFRRAWEACLGIPAGETRSYAWLAAAAGRPGAARAAGQAMARNPLPLIVPCHRVVGQDGDLRGYGGGGPQHRPHQLDLKARLLALEARLARPSP